MHQDPRWKKADQAAKAIETVEDTSCLQELQNQIEVIQNAFWAKVEQTRKKWKPICSDEIDAMSSDEKDDLKILILSDEAKRLLLEATKDPAGQILVINSLEGIKIQTNSTVIRLKEMLLYGRQF